MEALALIAAHDHRHTVVEVAAAPAIGPGTGDMIELRLPDRSSGRPRPLVEGGRPTAWRLAALALSEHRGEDARAHLDRAFDLDPDNWLIRKQRWALEQPDKFYDGVIDTDWQREQMSAGR